jgi:glycosyltransferase involved in cell wall biosynthesis
MSAREIPPSAAVNRSAEADAERTSTAATPRVSIIVPLHRMTPTARRCIDDVLAIPGDRHELIVVSDRPLDGLPARVTELTTGAVRDTSPAEKRDAAMAHVRGDICAFLDDDAYPGPEWLDRAIARFDRDAGIAAVGGPGTTPPGSGFRERLGGAFYESWLGSGGLRNRFVAVGDSRDTDDWPAYNLFVRTDVLRSIGGWASKFYGGEDTKLCLTLIETGHRIVYDPEVVVYHLRRPMFRAHMRQLANVGRHRGWFVHAFPRTSARAIYFAPSLALLGAPPLVAWAFLGPRKRRRQALVAAASIWTAISMSGVQEGFDAKVAAALPLGLAAGHGAYGAGFLRGFLLTDDIDEM